MDFLKFFKKREGHDDRSGLPEDSGLTEDCLKTDAISGKAKEDKMAENNFDTTESEKKLSSLDMLTRGSSQDSRNGQRPSESDPQNTPITETESHQEAKVRVTQLCVL